MPILQQEPALYPEDLLQLASAGGADRRWWVFHTRPRQEKSLARQLFAMDVPFYLPLVTRDLLYRGRRVRSRVPLFAGYLFLYGTDEERILGLKGNRVSRVMATPDASSMVHDLLQIQRLIASKAPLTVEQRLSAGQTVQVRSGPFMGLVGTVISRRAETRLLVAVKFLQQGVSLEIDDFLLEPI